MPVVCQNAFNVSSNGYLLGNMFLSPEKTIISNLKSPLGANDWITRAIH